MPIWTDYPTQTTPDDADTLLAHDASETVVGQKMKRTTWANIKAALKAALASATPTASTIPIADAAGKLAVGWMPTTVDADKVDGAHASVTPTASTIPIADDAGKLAVGWMPATEAWHVVGVGGEPAFANSWVNFDGSVYATAAFFKDSQGIVHLKGFVKSGTLGGAAFVLPAGYRPALSEYFACNSNSAYGNCHVNAGGDVIPSNGSNASFSLSGITFRAA